MSEARQPEKDIRDTRQGVSDDERTVYQEEPGADDSKIRHQAESGLPADTQERGKHTTQDSVGPSGTIITDSDATVGATTISLASEESLGDFIGRYKLLEHLGEGGFGMVYVAEQTEPVKRRVALKIIKLGMDTRQVVARFEAERQALALMDHPNIAKVLDAGATDTGRPFFVMELVRGTKITEHCDRNKLSTRKRLDLFVMVCRAVEHAHQKGIIHRDIKPSNILVTLHDGVPVPKVIDFGIAKATQGSLTDKTVYTQMDQFVGTPAYMSPEQADAGTIDIDTRTDIYSLGVLLYELLTGETPLESKNLLARGYDEMRRLIREWEPQMPSARIHKHGDTTIATKHGTDTHRLVRLVQGDLDWVVMKCLEKDRDRRYNTAAELTVEIQHFLANEPVQARPPGNWYRLQKLVRRNRLAFAAGLAIFTSLVIALCITSFFMVSEKHSRDVAEEASQRSSKNLRIALSERFKAEQALAVAREANRKADLDQKVSQAAQRNEADAKAQQMTAEKVAATAEGRSLQAAQEAQAALARATAAEKKAAEAAAQADAANSRAKEAANLATSADAARVAAEKTAVDQTTQRQMAEAASLAASAARMKAEWAASNAVAETMQAHRTVSDMLAGLFALPPAQAANAVKSISGDATVIWARAEWRARSGDWKNAAVDFVAVNQSASLPPLLWQSGDTNSYVQWSIKLLTNTSVRGEIIAEDALLAPMPGIDVARAAAAGTNGIAHLLAEYRLGHFASAVGLGTNALLAADKLTPAQQTATCALLAMAQQQLKQVEAAKLTLARGNSIATDKMAKLESGDIGSGWRQWILARALVVEANATVK